MKLLGNCISICSGNSKWLARFFRCLFSSFHLCVLQYYAMKFRGYESLLFAAWARRPIRKSASLFFGPYSCCCYFVLNFTERSFGVACNFTNKESSFVGFFIQQRNDPESESMEWDIYLISHPIVQFAV